MAEENSVAKGKEFNSHLLFTNLQSINLVTESKKIAQEETVMKSHSSCEQPSQ